MKSVTFPTSFSYCFCAFFSRSASLFNAFARKETSFSNIETLLDKLDVSTLEVIADGVVFTSAPDFLKTFAELTFLLNMKKSEFYNKNKMS